MPLEKKLVAVISFIIHIFILSLILCASLTDFWIEAGPLKLKGNERKSCWFHSGLFFGTKQLDYGYGPEMEYFSVIRQFEKKTSFYNINLWLLLLFSLACSTLFTVVGMIVSLFNIIDEDKETITGLKGLLLWDGVAASFSTSALSLFLYQYLNKAKQNILTESEKASGITVNQIHVGISYWILCLGLFLLAVPITLILLTKKKETSIKKQDEDPTIMLY